MADAEFSPSVPMEPVHLRLLGGGAVQAPAWDPAVPEPTYDQVYVVQIYDANPKHFRAQVMSIPVTGITSQSDLRPDHLNLAITNGTLVPNAVEVDLDLRLKSVAGALVIFHLIDLDATFEDPAQIGKDESIVLSDTNAELFQSRWLGHQNKAVSTIFKGNALVGKPRIGRYGLRIKITVPASDTVSYVEIDPKIENQGGGGIPI